MFEKTRKNTFGFIELEGRSYPSIIMGEDRFTGWFGKDMFSSEKKRAGAYGDTIRTAYDVGVRGFSMSPHDTLLAVLCDFKEEHPDIVCIANPHWQSHYYIGDSSMWKKQNLERLAATVAKRCPELGGNVWFRGMESSFSDKEIAKIRLDIDEQRERLQELGFCDFSLVGNLGRSALVLLGRQDIIEQEIDAVRKQGMCPIGMCEATSGLPVMEKLDVAACWTWINKDFACPDVKTAADIIKKAKKPVTAYRVLSSPKGFDLEGSIRFMKEIKNIQSMVIGVKNPSEAKDTFSKIKEMIR